MCGRYTLTQHTLVASQFNLFNEQDHDEAADRVEDSDSASGPGHRVVSAIPGPRYNIAPTQPVPVIRERHTNGRRILDVMNWGLIPRWARPADVPGIGSRMINARSESAAVKPAFKAAMKYRRCLLPADGFFEWTAPPTAEGAFASGRPKSPKAPPRQPYWITLADHSLFGFAGLYEHWQGEDGSEIVSCTILTTAANDLLAALHDRMPVIIPAEAYARWLDPRNQDPHALADLLAPYPAELMDAQPVSPRVNRPAHDDPGCIERIDLDPDDSTHADEDRQPGLF